MYLMGNFPDVLYVNRNLLKQRIDTKHLKSRLPALDQFWGYIFFFVLFVLFVPWFLMALVLASVSDLYKEEFKVQFQSLITSHLWRARS